MFADFVEWGRNEKEFSTIKRIHLPINLVILLLIFSVCDSTNVLLFRSFFSVPFNSVLLSFVFFVAEIHKFYSNFSANVWLSSPLFIILFLSFYPVDEKNSSTSSHTAHTQQLLLNIRQQRRVKKEPGKQQKRHTLQQAKRKRGDLLSFHSHQRFPPLQCAMNWLLLLLLPSSVCERYCQDIKGKYEFYYCCCYY